MRNGPLARQGGDGAGTQRGCFGHRRVEPVPALECPGIGVIGAEHGVEAAVQVADIDRSNPVADNVAMAGVAL